MAEAPTQGAIQEIRALVEEGLGKTVEIGGVAYATRALHDVRKADPEPKALVVATLMSFAEYVRAAVASGKDATTNPAYLDDKSAFVHVESPTGVRFVTDIFGDFNQQVVLATAQAVVPEFKGVILDLDDVDEDWANPETFNIALQAMMIPTAPRNELLKLVGNLTWAAEATTADDGVSQLASSKVGISLAGPKTATPNPWNLAVRRTFPEVTQPDAPFILRLRGGGTSPKEVALFAADGGEWRLAAINNIKTWLAGELPGVAVYG